MDDLTGRRVGAQCGAGVWALARQYFDGSITQVLAAVSIRALMPGQNEVRCATLRGFFYKLQSTADLGQAFTDDPAGFALATDCSMVSTDSVAGPSKFYRLMRAASP